MCPVRPFLWLVTSHSFTKDNLSAVLKLPIDMNCLNSDIVAKACQICLSLTPCAHSSPISLSLRRSSTFQTQRTSCEIVCSCDKLRKFSPRYVLFVTLIAQGRGLLCCVLCKKVYADEFQSRLVCLKATPFVDFRGRGSVLHRFFISCSILNASPLKEMECEQAAVVGQVDTCASCRRNKPDSLTAFLAGNLLEALEPIFCRLLQRMVASIINNSSRAASNIFPQTNLNSVRIIPKAPARPPTEKSSAVAARLL